jgi:hypothetical protein
VFGIRNMTCEQGVVSSVVDNGLSKGATGSVAGLPRGR